MTTDLRSPMTESGAIDLDPDVHTTVHKVVPDRNRIAGLTYAMGHVLLPSSCCVPPLEAAVDEARELGRELGRRFVHEDIPAGQQGGVDL